MLLIPCLEALSLTITQQRDAQKAAPLLPTLLLPTNTRQHPRRRRARARRGCEAGLSLVTLSNPDLSISEPTRAFIAFVSGPSPSVVELSSFSPRRARARAAQGGVAPSPPTHADEVGRNTPGRRGQTCWLITSTATAPPEPPRTIFSQVVVVVTATLCASLNSPWSPHDTRSINYTLNGLFLARRSGFSTAPVITLTSTITPPVYGLLLCIYIYIYTNILMILESSLCWTGIPSGLRASRPFYQHKADRFVCIFRYCARLPRLYSG